MPPVFTRMAGHPLRWRLLRELAHGDRRVRELAKLIGEPQSLVSYHLGRLRSSGLVAARRSTFDGRDSYYRLDLARCAELLAAAGAALHPALDPGLRPDPVALSPAGEATGKPSGLGAVLFLCTGNSARSQAAEALARVRSGGRVQAFSAGSHPRPLHQDAVRVMASHGVDLVGQRSKHLGVFVRRRFTHVITLCDRVRRSVPSFRATPRTSTGASPTRWPSSAATGTPTRRSS
jgi:DNA-binding transcriptional ArsR family regulator